MYSMSLDENESILELSIENNLNEDELRKLLTDLKLKGLKHVVLQTPEKNSPHVQRLKQIYSGLSIRVNVTLNFLESQKRLGLFR